MLKCVANHLRDVVALMGMPDGDVKIKMYEEPKIKPPRRQTPTQNVTNRSDYMQTYMKNYREHGKDYQKMPAELKKRRREQRKRQKQKLKPMTATLIDQELTMWGALGKVVAHDEFEALCNRRGFNEEEKIILAEELHDLGLILY